ncbi:MAG: nucleotidyltransferase family protein [Planctomycetes bacterium]|nr:nucleotidyltransferase family protein [Planctomycetota bacterium]
MKTRDEILQALSANRATLKGLGVRKIALFGSAARGEASPSSDVDILVRLDRETFDAYMDLKEFLESVFGCPVDLILEDGIKPRLRAAILAEAIHAPGL